MKSAIRRAFNLLGLDVRRLRDSPDYTLLALGRRPIATIIDVGSNRGQFCRKISPFFPEANFFCFDPLPEACAALKNWGRTRSGVHVYQKALGDTVGSAVLLHHVDHDYSSSLLAETGRAKQLFPITIRQVEIEVPVSTLDYEFSTEDSRIKPEVLLKIDVQGYEDRVLQGAMHFLSQVSAVIIELCVAPLYEEQAGFLEICQQLHAAGLNYAGNLGQSCDVDGSVLYLDAVFCRNSLSPGNGT